MTVNSRCFRLYLLIFIESVCSIQNTYQQGSSLPICTHPYSCILTSECAERHSAQGTDEVLFQCEERNTVCCPPVKSPFPTTVPFGQTVPNAHTTTERGFIHGCTKCSDGGRPHNVYDGERPQESYAPDPPGNSQNFPTMGSHVHNVAYNIQHTTQPTATRKPAQTQSSESRRPPQGHPVEGRRPPLSQTARPQAPQPLKHSLTSHKNFKLLPNESNCGVNNFANRITEGEEVSLGEYPWMVLTGLKDRYGNYRWNCGGTLINGWYVLTAAHCLNVDNRTIEYVRLGEHSLRNDTDCYRELCLDPPEDIRIAEVIPHEKWNTTTIKNDIALLRLSRNPLNLGKSNIYPICLPIDENKLNITSITKYEVAGWGKTDWNADEGSDVLRKASISGVTREECNICKDNKQQYCPIIDTQLCVQGWKSVDVCKGDSGGPLMITRLNIYQIGITSFKGSEYCGAENIPSIFTKVQSFLPWILDNIRE